MDFEFKFSDIVLLSSTLLGLAAVYWKIVSRLQITELKVKTLESDSEKQESKHRHEMKASDGRIEKRLENIEKKIDGLTASVLHLEALK